MEEESVVTVYAHTNTFTHGSTGGVMMKEHRELLSGGEDSTNSEVRYVLVILCGVLAIFYFVETILKGFPPIGPGTCSFLFWIVCGYIDGSKAQRERGFAL